MARPSAEAYTDSGCHAPASIELRLAQAKIIRLTLLASIAPGSLSREWRASCLQVGGMALRSTAVPAPGWVMLCPARNAHSTLPPVLEQSAQHLKATAGLSFVFHLHPADECLFKHYLLTTVS